MEAMAYSLAVAPAGEPRTWTVLDGSYATVLPVEDWLDAHRYLWSPNTVRGYATALAQWWSFLEQRGEADRWRDVGVPAVTAFLSWLRNRRTVEHSVGTAEGAPSESTLEARLAAVISFYRWQGDVRDVPVARAPVARGAEAAPRPRTAVPSGRSPGTAGILAGSGAPPSRPRPTPNLAARTDPSDPRRLRGLRHCERAVGG
jgi:hypothetical protein